MRTSRLSKLRLPATTRTTIGRNKLSENGVTVVALAPTTMTPFDDVNATRTKGVCPEFEGC